MIHTDIAELGGTEEIKPYLQKTLGEEITHAVQYDTYTKDGNAYIDYIGLWDAEFEAKAITGQILQQVVAYLNIPYGAKDALPLQYSASGSPIDRWIWWYKILESRGGYSGRRVTSAQPSLLIRLIK